MKLFEVNYYWPMEISHLHDFYNENEPLGADDAKNGSS